MPSLDDPRRPDPRVEFERFVVAHSRELGRLAYLLVGDRDDADDLAADALLAAWVKWESMRSLDRPIGYVRRILANQAADRVRRATTYRRRIPLLYREATEPAPSRDSAAVLDVRSALSQLPPRRRACLVLRYGFDLAEPEVAAILGISVGTVKSQTARACEQLRRLIGPGPGAGLEGPRLGEPDPGRGLPEQIVTSVESR